ncbi:MAG: hypothetical protein EOO27_06365 [Comamonadaceae bacterium]|nr:MAG: hypothetical protein EOO27_06365 [Comamonadaceae bacterium]
MPNSTAPVAATVGIELTPITVDTDIRVEDGAPVRPELAVWLEEAANGTILRAVDGLAWQKGNNVWWVAGAADSRESYDLVGEGPFVVLYDAGGL